MRLFRFPLSVLFLVVLAALLPGFASADSLVYVKGGDVWLSEPDGNRQTRLTRDGGYRYASQSEGGAIAASRGSRVVRLSRTGQVLGSFATAVGENDSYGPYDTEISPDGRTIAYEYFHHSDFWGLRLGVAYMTADGQHIGETHTGWSYPAWIDNRRLIHSGGPTKLHTDVMIREAGGPNSGDISRDGSVLAFVAGEDEGFLTVYRNPERPGEAVPEYCYHYLEPQGKYGDPAIAPDASGLAWEEADGIHVGPLPDLASGCAMPNSEGGLVIPGGQHPDWGPAAVPAPPRPGLRPAGRQKLGKALGRGLDLKVTGVPAGTRVRATLPKRSAKRLGLGRKAVVVATGRTSAAGKARLTFKRALVRKLRKAKSLTLTVTAGAARSAITLRR